MSSNKQRPTLVVKLGGNAIFDGARLDELASDVKALVDRCFDIVVVHGGGPQIDQALSDRPELMLGSVDGLRITPPAAIPIIDGALDDVREMIVVRLRDARVDAVGMAGQEVLTAELHENRRLQSVGNVSDVDTTAVANSIDNGNVVVLSTLAKSSDDAIVNVNADPAAASIAAKLRAQRLILLTNTTGLFTNVNDPTTLIKDVRASRLRQIARQVDPKIRPKFDAVFVALEGGVDVVDVVDGRSRNAVLSAIDNRIVGTKVRNEEPEIGFAP